MHDMFTSQVAHPILKKVFKRWNKTVCTRGAKVKTRSESPYFLCLQVLFLMLTLLEASNIFQLGSRASMEFPPLSSPIRPPPARDFILAPTASASRMAATVTVSFCGAQGPRHTWLAIKLTLSWTPRHEGTTQIHQIFHPLCIVVVLHLQGSLFLHLLCVLHLQGSLFLHCHLPPPLSSTRGLHLLLRFLGVLTIMM
jgi:hypothetical protein